MNNNLTVSRSPHVRDRDSTNTIMRDVCIAMMPAAIMGIVIFGAKAALLLVLSALSDRKSVV